MATRFRVLSSLLTGVKEAEYEKLWLIKLRDARSGEARGIAEGHTGRITALAFSDDGQQMASASLDGTIKLWNVAELLSPIRAVKEPVQE